MVQIRCLMQKAVLHCANCSNWFSSCKIQHKILTITLVKCLASEKWKDAVTLEEYIDVGSIGFNCVFILEPQPLPLYMVETTD